MSKKDTTPQEMSLPVIGMLILGSLGAITVAAQTAVITVWPLPVSIAPYFGPEVGVWWGLIVGSLVGLFVGFISDERHYDDTVYK